MNKAELIHAIAASTDLTKKDAEKALTATLDAITTALAEGDKVLVALSRMVYFCQCFQNVFLCHCHKW